jgi:cell division septum initiation protein DivIVA
MAEELTQNPKNSKLENDKLNFNQYGFRSASRVLSNSDSLEGFLDNVYDNFLNEQKLDEQGLRDRISKLKAEVQQGKVSKNDSISEISSSKRQKEDKEKEIEELEIEKIEIRNEGVETSDTMPFVIGAFITLLLTMYLFVFYSSSGYSAFYGIKQGSLGFINPNVFSDAMNRGGGVISLIVLFPVIFLGLGFLIHDSLETNKKLVSEKKPKTFSVIITLLFITLIADMFIGYKISQGVHTNEFNAGLTDKIWQFSMIFSDINFYLVIVLGFVVYVIWGFLLNYVLSHPYLKTENERVKLITENLNIKINEKRNELTNIISRIHRKEGDVESNESKILDKENDIIGYQNGVIPINVPLLKASVGEFMGGWENFTNGHYGNNIGNLLFEANKEKENWLQNKLINLKSDN